MKKLLQDIILERPLLGDGAMGTQLMLAGLEQGNCGEAWNLTHPERVLAIQRRYVDAGSDCLITNTFGGSRIMLTRHSEANHVVEVQPGRQSTSRARPLATNQAMCSVISAPSAVCSSPSAISRKPRFAAPSRNKPRALVEAGADAIIIETQTSLEELLIGIQAAQAAGAKCIIGSMAYDVTLDGSTFRTMMGIEPERAAEFMEEHGAHIVALNCGTGMEMERARDAVERYKKVTSLPVMVQPNAGKPQLINMKVVYDETPEQMVKGLLPLLEVRRQHHRFLLRQHARPHSRIQKSDGRIPRFKRNRPQGRPT